MNSDYSSKPGNNEQDLIKTYFADLISSIRENPRDNNYLHNYINGLLRFPGFLHKKNAGSIVSELLGANTDPTLEEYLHYFFLTAFGAMSEDECKSQTSQIAQDPISLINRLGGYYGALGKQVTSRRLIRLAACFEAIENGGKVNIYKQLTEFINEVRPIQSRPEDCVCFVTECNITVRIRKLAYAARAGGKKVRLIIRSTEHFPAPDPKDFDEIVTLPEYFDPVSLWQAIDQTPAQAIHCFIADRHGYMEALAVMAARPDLCVIDFYDFSHEDIGPMKRLEVGSEQWKEYKYHTHIYRFLLNHMSGHCARTLYNRLQKSDLKELIGRQTRVVFPELCWGREPNAKKFSEEDGMLHAVAASTFFVGDEYNDEFSGYPLIDNAERLGIHLHLYALTFAGTDKNELKRVIESRPNCHFHEPLPYEKWQSEAEKYDVGLFRLYPRDHSQMKNIPVAMDPTRAWSNKFGDFLDANVYMIFGSDIEYQCFVAKRYGIGEGAEEEDLLTPEYWDQVKTKVLKRKINFALAKRSLVIEKQGAKLARFYDQLADTNPYVSS